MSWSIQLTVDLRDWTMGVQSWQEANDRAGEVLPEPLFVEDHYVLNMLPCVAVHLIHTRLLLSRVGRIQP